MSIPSLTVIILTFNEEKHIRRCIESIKPIAQRVVVVDSYSTDMTTGIAYSLGAEVFQHTFINQAQLFQWALDNVGVKTDWILRVDADEYCMPGFHDELRQTLPALPESVTGLYVNMRVYFMDKWIRRGYYPMVLLRIWRTGVGSMQMKWMDERIQLSHGETRRLTHDLADHNLNNLSWWTAKHNNYALREAVDRLNREYHFLGSDYATGYADGARTKWYKSMYMRLPLFVRPFFYFIYRYVFRLGFLEGKEGLIWHVLQGFWCQFLIDAKIYQIKTWARTSGRSVKEVLVEDFNVKIDP
jgi:glycosyltransferase involved in cell wall biosynthesis